MGNLKSVVGDCQLGELPAYLQSYLRKEGDEAYVVYSAEQLQMQMPQASVQSRIESQAPSPAAMYYFSGPQHQHVRAKLLSELVDLCVDASSDEQCTKNNTRVLESREWTEAELRAEKDGTLRATPWQQATRTKTSNENNSRKKKRSKSKRSSSGSEKRRGQTDDTKTNASSSKEPEAQSEDGFENDIGSDVQSHFVKMESLEMSSEKLILEDPETSEGDYHSEVEEGNEMKHTLNEQNKLQDHLQEEMTSNGSTSDSVSENSRCQSMPARTLSSLSSRDQVTLRVQREEEFKLRDTMFTIFVHDLEVPVEFDGDFFLLEAGWFRAWSDFLQGSARPGRIRNLKLLHEGKPWPGLLAGKDYVALNETSWKILRDIYGADLELRRKTYDIQEEVD